MSPLLFMSLLNLNKNDQFVSPVKIANIPQTAKNKSRSRMISFRRSLSVSLDRC